MKHLYQKPKTAFATSHQPYQEGRGPHKQHNRILSEARGREQSSYERNQNNAMLSVITRGSVIRTGRHSKH